MPRECFTSAAASPNKSISTPGGSAGLIRATSARTSSLIRTLSACSSFRTVRTIAGSPFTRPLNLPDAKVSDTSATSPTRTEPPPWSGRITTAESSLTSSTRVMPRTSRASPSPLVVPAGTLAALKRSESVTAVSGSRYAARRSGSTSTRNSRSRMPLRQMPDTPGRRSIRSARSLPTWRRTTSGTSPRTATAMVGKSTLTSRTTGRSASTGKSSRRLISFEISMIALVMSSTSSSKWKLTYETPSFETPQISSTLSTSPTAFSIGIVTSCSISSGDAPT